MLTEMTDGDTKQQVMDLLGAADSETLRQTVRDMWMSVYLDDGRSVCRLANGAFLRENADVKQEAVDALVDWYMRPPTGCPWARRRRTRPSPAG